MKVLIKFSSPIASYQYEKIINQIFFISSSQTFASKLCMYWVDSLSSQHLWFPCMFDGQSSKSGCMGAVAGDENGAFCQRQGQKRMVYL